MKKAFLALAAILVANAASANTLWRDSINYSPYSSNGTYSQGRYESLRQNDYNRNPIYSETIRDRSTGQYLDCDNIGICRSR